MSSDPSTEKKNDSSGVARRSNPAPSRTLQRFVAWTAIGMALGLFAMLMVLRAMTRDPTPALTPELFHAAHEQWKKNPLQNYDVEVRVTGPQAADYRVEVRDGEARAAWRNGKPLTSRRTYGTWSIPGMFSTISRDIEALQRAEREHRQMPLILRAAFSADHAVPEHYRRIDNGSRKGSDSITVTWDVIDFHIVQPAQQPSP
jgi:hypothetical protein